MSLGSMSLVNRVRVEKGAAVGDDVGVCVGELVSNVGGSDGDAVGAGDGDGVGDFVSLVGL